MTPLRFGVVGCGAVVTLNQLPALQRCPALQLVGTVDRDREWAARVARRERVPAAYGDHRELIGRVDAALVATPNATHASIVCDLLEQGVHVLCEKPLGTTGDEVERMLDAAARGGARLMTGHCLRFSPNLEMLKRVIDTGWIGDVERVHATIGGPYQGVARRTDFRCQRALSGGGVLMDLGVHVLDLAVWFAGRAPRSVEYAESFADGWEVETDAEVALRFPGDARASLQASFSAQQGNSFTVRGTKGWARASLYVSTELTVFAEEARICRRAGLQTLRLRDRNMYDAQIEHFCRAIGTGEPFRVRDAEVRATIAVIDHCYARRMAA
jgi:predicted dehydrogenase